MQLEFCSIIFTRK